MKKTYTAVMAKDVIYKPSKCAISWSFLSGKRVIERTSNSLKEFLHELEFYNGVNEQDIKEIRIQKITE